MTIKEQARRVIAEAGEAGGIDEVRRIAERGWPDWVDGAEPSQELRDAIQARAQSIVDEVAKIAEEAKQQIADGGAVLEIDPFGVYIAKGGKSQ
jgi:hypothetical protein